MRIFWEYESCSKSENGWLGESLFPPINYTTGWSDLGRHQFRRIVFQLFWFQHLNLTIADIYEVQYLSSIPQKQKDQVLYCKIRHLSQSKLALHSWIVFWTKNIQVLIPWHRYYQPRIQIDANVPPTFFDRYPLWNLRKSYSLLGKLPVRNYCQIFMIIHKKLNSKISGNSI